MKRRCHRAIITLAILLAGAGQAAAQSCTTQLSEFREVVKIETSMGHVSPMNQSGAMAELARIEQACRAGRNEQALQMLHALQRRMKFR